MAASTHTDTPLGSPGSPKKGSGKRVRVGNRELLLTRRHFLYGAVGVGAAAAVAVGASALANRNDEEEAILTLEVADTDVFQLDDCGEESIYKNFTLAGTYDLPFGTLLWATDDNYAACLLPTETSTPLTKVGMLNLGTGDYWTVFEQAQGQAEGFEIYDVRATQHGLIWTEANILDNKWRIWCAPLNEVLAAGIPRLLAEGGTDVETPSLGAVGNFAFWQIMPPANSDQVRRGPAAIYRTRFDGSDTGQAIYECKGRLACPIYSCEDAIVIAPRHPDSSWYYQLVRIDAESGREAGVLTLPQGMRPNLAGYGPNGFSFCFDAIYDYGGGISNLGTYTPASQYSAQRQYAGLTWFRFGRTPYASPAWCTDAWFIVKSTMSVCAVDLLNKRYCPIEVADGCTSWGDYLVSSGTRGKFVTAMQIDYVSTTGVETKSTRVRVWTPGADPNYASREDNVDPDTIA